MAVRIVQLLNVVIAFFCWDVFIPVVVYWPDMTLLFAWKFPVTALWAVLMPKLDRMSGSKQKNDV